MIYKPNKYNLQLQDSSIMEYNKKLIGSFFKIIGIYEGKDSSKTIKYSKEESYNHYQKYIKQLIFEIDGAKSLFQDKFYITLLCLLEEMSLINEHEAVTSLVFQSISVLEYNIKNKAV
jgi:hypothetical protein